MCLALAPHRLMAETMRVRLAWGGGSERLWEGTVSLDSEGTLSQPQPLGIEADEPGSMWLLGQQLMIRQRSARAYDGVDLLVSAPLEAKLLVELKAADEADVPARVEIPLADLIGGSYSKPLDAKGNRLLVRRTPGDKLRVQLERDSLIFSSLDDQVFRLQVEPHLLPLAAGSEVQIEVQLVGIDGKESLWSAQQNVLAGRPTAIPLEVQLPDGEGVYDLTITATRPANWQQAVRRPLRPQDWRQTVAQRRIQFLVLSPDRPTPSQDEGQLGQVVEIDPANPKWHEKLGLDRLPTLPTLPRLWKPGPLGNGHMSIRQHPLGKLARLGPSGESPDVSWEAYTLPIDRPGRPHILEVDYPSDVSQTLGISILEPNAAEALMPIGLDSGIDSGEEVADDGQPPRWVRHRLIFWPRTTTPMVLMTNRRDRLPAMYGKIRVLAGWEHLPRNPADQSQQVPQRLLAAYLDRPLFPENFSARESLDSGRSLDDWQTFYEGATRLVEYLHHVGYNGLMLAVLADGSTIYPSKILQPTPRYDTGVFFATAQDPVRKDVLEMLLRLFDREGLRLIPMVDFSAPLPGLEAVRRQGRAGSQAVEWIDKQGATWCQTHPTRRALAPYYNLLQPRVQEEMLAVVQELVVRYADHDSFGGLAIRLSGHGYAQLPGPTWGMDDATIARFQQEVKLQVPGAGTSRFAQRAAFLGSDEYRRRWLEWRAGELSRFYRRARQELEAIRPGCRLYLAGANALASPELQAGLRPALPQRTTLSDALLQVGINVRHFENHKGLVLLRPERVTPTGPLGTRAANLEINQMPDVDNCFHGLSVPGNLFFHQPQEVRIESFDRKSPFRSTYTWLVAQPVPSGRQNRRRFVHSLATLDPQVVVDGGWTLPLGQEESIRDLVVAYRRLPAVPFRRAGGGHAVHASQPVTFRYGTHAGRTYVYAVNDAPFSNTAWVRVDAPAGTRLEELTGSRQVSPLKRDTRGTYWMVELRPYDLVAVQLSAPGVQLSNPRVPLPEAVETTLAQRIRDLADRAALLPSLDNPHSPPRPLKALSNPGFERPAAEGEPISGWATTQRAGVTIAPDKTRKHAGKQSVRMTTEGPWACLVSEPFGPPTTGRLSMSVWLRVARAAVQPSLQLAFEGRHHGEPYYRWAEVGRVPGNPQAAVAIGTDWSQYVFQVDDLPLEGLTEFHVRLDLMGPGEVSVDDVELFDLAFTKNEVKELKKLIDLARVTLQNGEVADCIRLLEGYWPQFLQENVPLRPGPIARKPDPFRTPAIRPSEGHVPDSSDGTSEQSASFMDRVKGLLPKRFR